MGILEIPGLSACVSPLASGGLPLLSPYIPSLCPFRSRAVFPLARIFKALSRVCLWMPQRSAAPDKRAQKTSRDPLISPYNGACLRAAGADSRLPERLQVSPPILPEG